VKIGEPTVTEMMRQVGAVIGGEGNGGVIYHRSIKFLPRQSGRNGLILILADRDRAKTVTRFSRTARVTRGSKEKLDAVEQVGEILKMVRGDTPVIRWIARRREDSFKDAWIARARVEHRTIIRLVVEARDETRARQIWTAF